MVNSLSRYASDEEICSLLRTFFDFDVMWSVDFMSLLSGAVEFPGFFELCVLGRVFRVDKVTGSVVEVSV